MTLLISSTYETIIIIIIIEEKNVAPTKRTRDGDVVVIKSTYVCRYERCVIYLNILVFLHTRSRTSL